MLLSTGFLFALTEGYQNKALSNQVDGLYSHQTIVGATWQASNSGTLPLFGKPVTIYHYVNNVRYDDINNLTNSDGQIIFNQTFSSADTYYYYATFAGDASYDPSTSAVVNINVGSNQSSNQGSNQAAPNVGSVGQTTMLSASTTTPEVGQPVTFTATLTGRQATYGDFDNALLLGGAFGLGKQAQIPFYPSKEIAQGANIFLGTYNIEHNVVRLHEVVGVNAQETYVNVTSLVSNRSLIYSNGGASVYS